MADRQIIINSSVFKLIPYGFCACGCGNPAPISIRNCPKRGYVKGRHSKFIHNHHCKGQNNFQWNNGTKQSDGYIRIKQPNHPNCDKDGYIAEHILVVEKVIEKLLPKKVVIHHINEDKKDNRHENLIACQDLAYHNLIHRRLRAFKACGHVGWLKCRYCLKYDDPLNLSGKGKYTRWHKQCYELLRK